MPSAARAYAPQRAPRKEAPIRVVPGRRSSAGLSPQLLFAVRVFMVVLAIFACVSCVRIGLASATVTTSIETESITDQVEEIRSGSAHLEVTESSLANPSSVKATAVKKLGMSAPYETANIVLDGDVVAYDAQGNLSLARSLAQQPVG